MGGTEGAGSGGATAAPEAPTTERALTPAEATVGPREDSSMMPAGGKKPDPDQPTPVIATSWRNQLYLDDAGDPRLRQFVDQFRVTETTPLSGNGCVGGVGQPGA